MNDEDIPAFLATLGLPGIVDAHVHFLPPSVQAAVHPAHVHVESSR